MASSSLCCCRVIVDYVKELSWPARVSCSRFHLTGHALPVDSTPLFLRVHHFLFLILSLCGSFFLYISLSARTICVHA